MLSLPALLSSQESTQQTNVYSALLEQDKRLVASKFPPISDWWKNTLSHFYNTKKRQLVLRVGRRGGKSSTLCRIAVAEALHGDHKIPPGDLGIVGIVSVSVKEARKRLRTIKAILDALGYAYKPLSEGEGVELVQRPVAFQVFAATLGGVVGGTWICGICDEVSRWKDESTGVNPATEVLGSLRPTMATQPNARLFLSSSALGTEDAHAVAFVEGNTAYQSVAMAETWVANPIISEPHTHELEPNERVWKREYACIPQAGIASVFDMSCIDACISFYESKQSEISATESEVLIIDASRGGDDWTWARMRSVWCKGKARLWVSAIGEVPKNPPNSDFTEHAIKYLVNLCKTHSITQICGDQYQAPTLRLLFSQHDLSFWEHTWTSTSKRHAVDTAERLFRDIELCVPAHKVLRAQLAEYSERISKSGDLIYGGSGPTDDFVQVLLTGLMAYDAGRIALVSKPADLRPIHGSQEYWADQERKMIERLESKVREKRRERDEW